jgi:ATP-dependent DNA helicase RecG
LGISNLQDVLFYLPFRYQDRTRLTSLRNARPGEEIVVEGSVVTSEIVMSRRRSLKCVIEDDTSSLTLRFFHFSSAQKNNLTPGTRIRCFGEVRHGATGFEMYHPEYSLLTGAKHLGLEETLTPVYPTTEGVSQARLRSIATQTLALLETSPLMKDWLAEVPLERFNFPALLTAILYVHKPPVGASVARLEAGQHPAQQRLAFEELLAHHLSLQQGRDIIRRQRAPRVNPPGKKVAQFRSGLPFSLTDAQRRVVTEIEHDMQQDQPMLRLLQGDVGSGKTVVAALAATLSHENNYQTAIMAPTEILAEQHLVNFNNWFSPLNIELAWLSGKLKGKKRQQQLDLIASGAANVVIGTHALFQNDVSFANLGLIIIDEQHKFGVHQRSALREKGVSADYLPHQLIMTATPIPRTLTMSVYADLDCSIIDQLPPGRSPVTTTVISDVRRPDVIQRVEKACQEGKQAYWVCTLVEESEVLQCQAAEATAKQLSEALPDITVALVHGRMSSSEKAGVMERFKQGEVSLLVATTVIEVGVDIPNASLMIIENPERLGLAQLHQLRGRIGRGAIHSHCLLMYQAPLSQSSKQRLGVMKQTTDGFRIAEEDLKIRGPGDVLGTRQTGDISFRIADIVRDQGMLEAVQQVADQIRTSDHSCIQPIIDRWIVDADRFSNV